MSKDFPLSGVNDVFNAIVVEGNYLGTSMFYGKGAGKFPTASAVVADVIESVRHINAKKAYLEWKPAPDGYMMDIMETESRYFVKSEKTMDEVKTIFGNVQFAEGSIDGNLAYITEKMPEKEFIGKIKDEHFIRVLEA